MFLWSFRTNNARKRNKRLFWAIGVLYFFSNSFVVDEFNRAWEIQTVPISDLPKCKVGVILGGFTTYDPTFDRVEFHGSADRLIMAHVLYEQDVVEKLLISGGSSKIINNQFREADNVAKYLSEIHFDSADLWIDREARNTYENALYTQQILEEKKVENQPFVLITSALHMRRSMAIYKKQNMKFIPFSVDRKSGPRKFDLEHLLVPSSKALNSWNSLLHEVVGYISYWFAGYV